MKKAIYEIVICILAVVSVIISVVDMTSTLSSTLSKLDNIIWLIFVFDYIIRLSLAKDKKNFIKTNVADLIAIIPFNSAFRVFRTFKFFKFVRLLKATRFISLILRMYKKCQTFLNTNGFKYMLLLSIFLISIGGVLISYFESMSLTDGIWWAFVTTTTVGYGDISPSSFQGRIIACILMIVGIGLIGSLTSTITSFFMNNAKTTANTVNSEKIEMVLLLYDQLSEEEKGEFVKLAQISPEAPTGTESNV